MKKYRVVSYLSVAPENDDLFDTREEAQKQIDSLRLMQPDDRFEIEKVETDEWEVISRYSQEQAIEDGILVKVGSIGNLPVVFTSNLFYDGYEDKKERTVLVENGLAALHQPDKEDSDYMKLRVLSPGRIWLILNGDGITFMKPEDY